MTSLVLELQQEALDRNVKISDLLRKALAVSRKLNISEIEEWVNYELTGYEEGATVPEFRTMRGRVIVPMPTGNIVPYYFASPNAEAFYSEMPFIAPASSLEYYLEGKQTPTSSIMMSYSPDVTKRLIENSNSKYPPMLEIQLTSLYSAVDGIRNTILKWALKLEEEGILGEGMTFNQKEKETAKTVNYNINHIYGDMVRSQIQQDTNGSEQSFTS